MTTMKDLLEKAITGVIKQGKPSLDSNGNCAYRGEGGGKCVVGVLIDDEHYNEDLEGYFTKALQVRFAVEGSNNVTLSDEEVDTLQTLQKCHDNAWDSKENFVRLFKSEVTGCVMLGKLPRYCLDFL